MVREQVSCSARHSGPAHGWFDFLALERVLDVEVVVFFLWSKTSRDFPDFVTVLRWEKRKKKETARGRSAKH